jgi:hypothetical protein
MRAHAGDSSSGLRFDGRSLVNLLPPPLIDSLLGAAERGADFARRIAKVGFILSRGVGDCRRNGFVPFDAMLMDLIADLWRGGSVRRLTRIVEALIDARENPQRPN